MEKGPCQKQHACSCQHGGWSSRTPQRESATSKHTCRASCTTHQKKRIASCSTSGAWLICTWQGQTPEQRCSCISHSGPFEMASQKHPAYLPQLRERARTCKHPQAVKGARPGPWGPEPPHLRQQRAHPGRQVQGVHPDCKQGAHPEVAPPESPHPRSWQAQAKDHKSQVWQLSIFPFFALGSSLWLLWRPWGPLRRLLLLLLLRLLPWDCFLSA